ncbi:DUF5329 domain-containing protein [Massilia sp.]|uniref:DUF5329 domain-containing protein n=1 Tax=Massilia sp. TaxID=1882437 RepID=UPI00289F18BB|nr:DUF5329 domain-containing protein [Massilia sp.]
MKPILLAVSAALLLSSTLAHAAPTPAAQAEIAHLVGYLKASGCSFHRNGSWYEAGKAAQHLDRKYEYLVKRDLVATSEDFIARAASESSISGKPYQVRCGNQAPVASAAWLKTELAKYRTAQRASR